MDSLRDFILEELDRRHQSVRAFAELVGVSHPAIGAIINPREGRQVKAPSVEFILKLARATGTNALMLLMLAYPELRSDGERLSGGQFSSLVRAQQIEKLPQHMRQLIDAILIERAQIGENNNEVERG
jgi:transcriptional regulator with XRE-family HTH domain